MATIKQKQVFKEVINGSTITKAMLTAGYAPSSAKRTNKVTRTKGWEELTENLLSDDALVKRHKEQLDSSKHAKLYFDIDDDDELIADVCKKLGVELLYVKINKEGTGKTVNVKAPDFYYRDLALDKGYKVKGRYPKESANSPSQVFILNVTGDSAQRFNVPIPRNTEDSSDRPA